MAKSQQPAYGKAADYVRQKDRSYVYAGPELKDRKGNVQITPGARVSRRQYEEKFRFSGTPYKTLEQKATYRKQLGFTPGPARGRKGVKPATPPSQPATPQPTYTIDEERGWRVVEFPSWDEAQLYISGQIAPKYPDDKVMVIVEGYLAENYEGDTPEDMTATRVWRTVTDTTFIASSFSSQISSNITANIQNWFREVTAVKVYWRPSRAELGRGDRNGR